MVTPVLGFRCRWVTGVGLYNRVHWRGRKLEYVLTRVTVGGLFGYRVACQRPLCGCSPVSFDIVSTDVVLVVRRSWHHVSFCMLRFCAFDPFSWPLKKGRISFVTSVSTSQLVLAR